MVKVKVESSFSVAIDTLLKLWPGFLIHCYVKDVQSNHFASSRSNIVSGEVVIQVYFSENYQTSYQDEIQSAHWAYNQVSLFTVCAWSKNTIMSYAIVSDYLQHDKFAFHTFLAKIAEVVLAEHGKNGKIQKVNFFSDGAASQFKQCFLFANLGWFKKQYEIEHLEWNFFAS